MVLFLYDNTYEGLLTSVFESYSRKIIPDILTSDNEYQDSLWTEKIEIHTDISKAKRVWEGLKKRLPYTSRNFPFHVFLAEKTNSPQVPFDLIRTIFDSNQSILNDFGNPLILHARKAEKKVLQEACRMTEFVRFQKTRDQIYFAGIKPDFDVLPLTLSHFKSRFADQQWILYDLRRDYGFYYNLKTIEEIAIQGKMFDRINGEINNQIVAEQEVEYQNLWKNFYHNICIKERINLKLQKRLMPVRYWSLMTEKKV